MTALEKFRNLLSNDKRYDPEAYNFVHEALDWTLKQRVNSGRRTNKTVRTWDLLEGIRRYAIEQFGCLAMIVLETWGVTTTDDFGAIAFNLVEYELMGKHGFNSKEDFHDAYDFAEVFDLSPVFCYFPSRGDWEVAYVTKPTAPPRRRASPDK